MLSFQNLVDLGSAAPRVFVMYQNISYWLTVDYLIAYKALALPLTSASTRKTPPWPTS